MDRIAEQLGSFLSGFDSISETYRRWLDQRFDRDDSDRVIRILLKWAGQVIEQGIRWSKVGEHLLGVQPRHEPRHHRMRSVRTAFDLMERINCGFQQQFPTKGQICENNKAGDESSRRL